jgi:shikimate kinase
MNILLLGARGCGKTTIGRLLAVGCGRRFVDLDDRVVARFDESTVQAIWATHGEAAWREAEVEALRQTLRTDDQVIALGGGTPAIDGARALIEAGRRHGRLIVVYLQCAADVLAGRLQDEPGDRPSLTGSSVSEEIAAVLARREPIYEALADHICQTAHEGPQAVVSSLLKRLPPAGEGRG